MSEKNQVNFTIGAHVFWKGHQFKIVALQGNNVVIYSEEHKSDSAIVVPKYQVEPIAEELFNVGDAVKSHNFFTGKVVGFEPDDNRVVCISTRDSNPGRKRFAYKPMEIVKIPHEPVFKRNQIAYIREVGKPYFTKVRALEYPGDSSLFVLYDVNIGTSIVTIPAETSLYELLEDFHIEFKSL